MADVIRPMDKWRFFLKKKGDDFFYENENFIFNLIYSFCCYINSPGWTYSQPLHKHPNYELHMVLEGAFQYETEDNEVFEVKEGEFVLHPPGFNHRIISETSTFSKLTMSFYFSPKDTYSSPFYQVAERRSYDNKILKCSEHMNVIIETIFQLSNNKPLEYNSSFFFFSISLILEIFRLLVGKETFDEDLKYKDDRINKAIEFIKSNISATLKVPDVAKRVHMSIRQFTKVFTEAVGVPPGTYIKNYRIKYIRNLLENSDLYINDIVNVMGYPDSAALIKAFKRAEGVSPAKYRKNMKKSRVEFLV